MKRQIISAETQGYKEKPRVVLRCVIVGCALLALSGCTMAPSYTRPDAPVPTSWPSGPAYKDVAKKYKGNATAEADLVAKLKSGKGHPAVKTSDEDTKTLVKWVLSQ